MSLKIVALCFICLVIFGKTVFTAVPGRNSISLYNANDKLHILTSQNFSSNVYQSKTAWVVEFYASWCGHCQAYAKKFREIGIDTWQWKTVVRIGVINCYSDENNEVCDNHNIRAYPTLRFIEPQTTQNASKVVSIPALEAKDVEREMIKQLTSLQRSEEYWPKFSLMTFATLDDLYAQILPTVKIIFMIVEEREDYIGRQVMLDFSKYFEHFAIFRTTPNATIWQQQGITVKNTPSLFAILLNRTINEVQVIKDKTGYRNLYNQLIRSYVTGKHLVDTNIDEEFQETNIRKNFIKNDDQHQSASALHKIAPEETVQTLKNEKLNMLDLETGLSYMLRREIPRIKEIQGETYTALINWLTVLNKYFPGREPVMAYLKRILTKLKEQSNGITGHQFRALADTNTAAAYLPDNLVEYKFCAGSSPQYRGYPCSLWVLFHTLTVAQAKSESEIVDILEIPMAIRGFIVNFFGCRHCAENFMKETHDMHQVQRKTNYEAMLYLWTVHNSVNKRLANDTTEDPKHPKIQFPSVELCPQCRPIRNNEDARFETKSIIDFFLQYYSKENIDISSVYSYKVDENESNADSRQSQRGKHHPRIMVELNETDSHSFFGIVPAIFQDISFYLIIGIVLIVFIGRRRYCRWKQKRHTI